MLFRSPESQQVNSFPISNIEILASARFASSVSFDYRVLPKYVSRDSDKYDLGDAIGNAKKEFEKFLQEDSALSQDFWSRVEQIKKVKGIVNDKYINNIENLNSFYELTLLDDRSISRTGGNIARGLKPPKKVHPVSLRMAMAVCVGLDLDIKSSEELLALAGHTLTSSRENQAYKYILICFRGAPIWERNEVLCAIGVAPLGSGEKSCSASNNGNHGDKI